MFRLFYNICWPEQTDIVNTVCHTKMKLALKVNKVPVFNSLSSELIAQMKHFLDVLTGRLRVMASKSQFRIQLETYKFLMSGSKIFSPRMEVGVTWHVLGAPLLMKDLSIKLSPVTNFVLVPVLCHVGKCHRPEQHGRVKIRKWTTDWRPLSGKNQVVQVTLTKNFWMLSTRFVLTYQ